MIFQSSFVEKMQHRQTHLRKMRAILLRAEEDGERCAGPTLLAGIAIGVGVIKLSSEALKQSSHQSLQILSILVLELMGPLLVSIFGMALLLPRWIERVGKSHPRELSYSVSSSAVVGACLMLMFFTAAMSSGILISSRSENFTELMDLLASINPRYFFRAILRCTTFLAILCAWCQWRAAASLKSGHGRTYIASNLLVEGLMISFTLKLLWFLIINNFASSAVST